MIIKPKIIAVVTLIIILMVGVATFIVLDIQGNKMITAKLEDAALLADIIEKTIGDDMKQGNTGRVQSLLQNIGKNREILKLRILSPEGIILKSADIAETGMSGGSDGIPPSELRKNSPEFNKTTINYFKDILNRNECYGCHNSTEKINGTIQITLDTSRTHATILSVKRLSLFSITLTVLLVSGVLSLLFSIFIIRPVKNLLSAIHEVESGNWNATVKIDSNNELENIGTSFNKMIGEINRLYERDINKEREFSRISHELKHKTRHEELNTELEFKIKELETANKAITSLSQEVKGKNTDLEKAVERLKKINEVSRLLSSIIDPDELLKIVTSTAADLLNSEKAVLHLHKNTCSTLQYRKESGLEVLDNFSFGSDPQISELLSEGKPLFRFRPIEGEGSGSLIGVPLQIKAQIVGALFVKEKAEGMQFTREDLFMLTTLSNHAVVAIENAWLYRSVKDNYFSTIQSLVNALEASDKFTKGHSERVRHLSLELGRHVGLDFRELEILEQASILHDIGKIGIESFILQKQGKLTPNEYSMIKAHPLIGEEILEPIETLSEVRQIILQHHERFDGKGYPYGLRGDELSLKAKILSVVDSFDAMMSDRPYRKAISIQKIKEEVLLHSGTQFDPSVVEAFIELLDIRGEDMLSSAGYFTFQAASKA